MAIYTFMRPDSGTLTPYATTAGEANWVLESTTAQPPPGQRRLIRFNWGSEESENNGAQRTRIARDTVPGSGARTAIVFSREDMIVLAPASAYGTYLSSGYGTTDPTVENGALYGKAWPVGGGVEWEAPPGGGFTLYGLASLECRQDVGAFDATFGGAWEE